MNNCKYIKNGITNGIEHEICINEELNKQNKVNGSGFICIGKKCGKYKEKAGPHRCEALPLDYPLLKRRRI